jgi:hypothetical protein
MWLIDNQYRDLNKTERFSVTYLNKTENILVTKCLKKTEFLSHNMSQKDW